MSGISPTRFGNVLMALGIFTNLLEAQIARLFVNFGILLVRLYFVASTDQVIYFNLICKQECWKKAKIPKDSQTKYIESDSSHQQ